MHVCIHDLDTDDERESSNLNDAALVLRTKNREGLAEAGLTVVLTKNAKRELSRPNNNATRSVQRQSSYSQRTWWKLQMVTTAASFQSIMDMRRAFSSSAAFRVKAMARMFLP